MPMQRGAEGGEWVGTHHYFPFKAVFFGTKPELYILESNGPEKHFGPCTQVNNLGPRTNCLDFSSVANTARALCACSGEKFSPGSRSSQSLPTPAPSAYGSPGPQAPRWMAMTGGWCWPPERRLAARSWHTLP